VLVLSVAAATAQDKPDKPDFSGRWVLEKPEPAGPDDPRALIVRQPIARTNAFGAPMKPYFKELAVSRHFSDAVRSETYQIGMMGGVVGGTVGGGVAPQSRFSTTWQGDRLVMETGTYSGSTAESGPYTERIETWHLTAEPKLVITVTNRGSGMATTTRTLTYGKQ
jgi:hypothetical protein